MSPLQIFCIHLYIYKKGKTTYRRYCNAVGGLVLFFFGKFSDAAEWSCFFNSLFSLSFHFFNE